MDRLPAVAWEGVMVQYAALDVSDKDTAIHVLDEQGKLVWKGKRANRRCWPQPCAGTHLSCSGWDWKQGS